MDFGRINIIIDQNVLYKAIQDINYFKNILDKYFEKIIFEDGANHPVEQILNIFLSNKENAHEWIDLIIRDHSYYNRYELLRCVGRLPYELVKDWAIPLVKDVLKWSDKTMRDAAICNLEVWDTPECMEILENHHDSDSLLADYVINILRHHYCF
jgi:hypothetical protein